MPAWVWITYVVVSVICSVLVVAVHMTTNGRERPDGDDWEKALWGFAWPGIVVGAVFFGTIFGVGWCVFQVVQWPVIWAGRFMKRFEAVQDDVG